MRRATQHPSTSAAQADALFVSTLQRCDDPSARQVRRAVTAALRSFGGQGCAERVAQEYGDHPETAAARMRWARTVVGQAFGDAAPGLAAARILTHRPVVHVRHAA